MSKNIGDFKLNPSNPRIIKDAKFKQLCKSIQDFPEMMEKRKMICVTDSDGKFFPLGGNMRLAAILHLKFKTIPSEWYELADEWTEHQRKQFLIKDNVSFGEWDFDGLANSFDINDLEEWGLDIPNLGDVSEDKTEKTKDKESYSLLVQCTSEKEQEALYLELINKGYECIIK